MAGDEPITVTIWSDVVCPFCNVARERAAWLREAGVGWSGCPSTFIPSTRPRASRART